MFTASAQLSGGSDARHPSDLAELVQAESRRVDDLTAQVTTLQSQVTRLSQAASVDIPAADPDLVRRESVAAGSVPVSGPGLTVQLDDAPASSLSIPGVRADDLVVHQQDLQHVINALWAGGAEAMTLQGERVTATSAFRCSGNILLLHGKVFSPPYVVEAIGDPAAMRAALDASPGVRTYRDYVDWVALGWNVRASDELALPAYTGSTELRFAQVPAGTEVR
ncbi:hypothetical protein DNL40_09280 [Xylanimonas oleitrophica]|uniref:DUF881 domain-containing protein n=2 Tax=Xylanimonas oleitrophica TaxID=2607479 RepID=A0A2W5WPA2_9MICO|nr:hypothetical protein DNL40_09280 [Xylanimonas oleitrophica]